MTKARKPLFSLGAEGKLGPLVISRLQRGSHKVAIKRPPANPNSPAQQLIRDYYGSGIETYRTLDEVERLYYHNLNKRQVGHRAYLNFMKEWLMAKLPLHWLDHILGGRDALSSPIAPAAHPAYDPTLIAAHSYPLLISRKLEKFHSTPQRAQSETPGNIGILANYIAAIPYPILKDAVANAIGFYVTTASTGKNARLGIYLDNGSLYPGTLLLDTGTVSLTGTGLTQKAITQPLPRALYWLVILPEASFNIKSISSYLPVTGMANAYQADDYTYHSQAYGSLPPTFPTASPNYYYQLPDLLLKFSA